MNVTDMESSAHIRAKSARRSWLKC